MNMIAYMTLGEYIGTLYSTGLFGKNKAKFGTNLFNAASLNKKVKFNEETVKVWISGKRNIRVKDYFPDGSIDESQFIDYLKQGAKSPGLWKELQKVFWALKPDDSMTWDCCIDLETENSDVFFWSLLNQFQRILQIPVSEFNGNNTAVSVSAPLQIEVSPGQIRNMFLEAIHQYRIMGIINRNPPILDRHDSACLNAFLGKTNSMVFNCNPQSSPLYASIKSFIDALQFQVLSLDATLNNRFGFDDETAAINMDNDNDLDEDNANLNRLNLPELSIELIADADDPVNLLKIAVEDWGNFRSKMNILFDDISSWQGKA